MFRDWIKNHNQLIDRRSFILLTTKSIFFITLLLRLGYLQIFRTNEYKTLSDKNRIKFIPIIPKRGQIFDYQGKELAINKKCFLVIIDLQSNSNYIQIIENLCKLLNFTVEQQDLMVQKIKKGYKNTHIIILQDISWDQVILIEKNIEYFTNIYIDVGYNRYYPEEYSISHIVGYTGLINEQEQKNININLIDLYIGKSGIEKYYETKLHGNFGVRKVEVNAYGKSVRELSTKSSIPGENLYLTLDLGLQSYIYNNILPQEGCSSAIITNVNTGNILALVSKPTFNVNYLNNKIIMSYWKNLLTDPLKPLIHKPIQSQYPPGSIFKIVTILAALRAGVKKNTLLPCYGKITIENHSFNCWYRNGHGVLDMVNAIKHSCNCYMYQIVKMIGPEIIVDTAHLLGLGDITNIDLPNEAKGFVPSIDWKKKIFHYKWNLGDSFNLSIGQGFTLVTLIQLSKLITAIASNKLWNFTLLKKDKNTYENLSIEEEYLNVIKEGLNKVVNAPGGTGYLSRIDDADHQFAGKTGTAQVKAKKKVTDNFNLNTTDWKYRNHAFFVGYAPVINPKYSATILVEHGGGGAGVAAPIAKEIFLTLFS